MPIPKPKDDEEQDEFIERCMSNDTMQEEYPDQKQRLAVCFTAWRKDKEEDSVIAKVGQIERRSFPIEMRVEGEENPKIKGVAAVFNKISEDLGGFREKILPGAFKKALVKSDVRALWNHNSDLVLGRTAAGTLELAEEEKGLTVVIDPPSWATPYLETIKRGDVTEMSFAFIVADKGEEWDTEKHIRTINEFDKIFDVSPCTYAAYPQTSVKVRMDDADKAEIVESIGRYLHPAKSEDLDIQGANDTERGRIDSLDILKKRLEIAKEE